MSLLIHSMAEFSSIVFPALETAHCRTVTEIGCEGGLMTSRLLEFVKERGGWMTSIDPAPSADAQELLSGTPFGVLHRDRSVRALGTCPPSDVYFIDGDHNYYSVMHELKLIEKMQKLGKIPFFAIMHDVGWPCAYRDQYYAPDQIPENWRQPFTWTRGLTLDVAGTIEGGFRGCGAWACAMQEGGEKNGVLKAAEDFLATRSERIRMALIPGVFGLGVLYATDSPWSDTMQKQLAPYDRNSLLALLERNRLANYLRVIEMQDANASSLASSPVAERLAEAQ